MTQNKRPRWREGDIVSIDLGNGQIAFGRTLKFPLMAFYDLKADRAPPVEEIIKHPVLFKVWVMRYAITKGFWPAIGRAPLEKELQETPLFFRQDPITTRLYIYQNGRRDIPATLEQVAGLERASVWGPEHVVQRLVDHFAGRPDRYAEMRRPKPVLSEKEQEERIRALHAKYKNLPAKKRARPAKQKTAKQRTAKQKKAKPTTKRGKK